ncbi:hypothetical protein [Rhizobium sp. CNPSo 4039]|jgi:MFS family permease|uniref:hypothetical protein n=1 Tax=Rhizobium sp. CNPSo 4039 TaxID=3021409 RepID=UPI000DDF8FD1|nr:hypothetical protein [Rhizobium sp. CNPSo 4039]MDK4712427.1 hypothetical protein [Rhizobium sp. CNPSo 4039]
MSKLSTTRFSRVGWLQWLAIIVMAAAGAIVTSIAAMPASQTNATTAAQNGGAIIGAFVFGMLLPYPLGWIAGRLANRSRNMFLLVFWGVAAILFLGAVAKLVRAG